MDSGPVDVRWIYPPGMARYITTLSAERPFFPRTEGFQNPDNLMSVRDDIYKLWHANAFSVDVDHENRIRIFDETAMHAGLPAHLEVIPKGSASHTFREHFRHTLCVHFIGGDIQTDYDPQTVNAYLVENGLDEEGTLDDFDPSDEIFQTIIGREVLECVIAERLRRRCEDTDDGDDGDHSE
ncbi:uncharacterized protein B0H18DRAFT_1050054 [Fomitopsis serialis]|uniref:uncharacterized protein n=1 Tax=Fomitopsis serialis TaxID=139415 RepID=UPI00200791F6|nr:uncharacterized protein B0H18DRAFT_1050054 [Neoantrodia serialis]KAH9913255.1 hypothetical protein B0H18DRAFT_1050054 [Neoantrodia serialis]